ncbi:Brix domain-domain-containing protein [Protomyces lactucae-debilis]|uniref:Brix domain-domain-containing protein n=1 Tax=Protomyces lactucae-debilis TaxID=2754530 RepID=A0A1Y2F3W6_PROLT|nr:Brix domain-containing protein [Protomyces lactucae-debilis]ORY78569.1 Brix domain-domain-containing protein [Protomyces lactucae-debilis]
MAKARTKKRTHKAIQVDENVPRSMVIQTSAATSGKALSQLVRDTRLLMAPHTAARLRERKNNKLRDYTTMAGPLGVTHLLLFSQSTSGPTLRVARTPRGPTCFFRVREYSLAKDISKILRNPKSPGPEFAHAPLLVMNNFAVGSSKEHPEEELLRTTFANMFPNLNTATASLASMKRVVLLHRTSNEPGADIELRHYAINTRSLGADKKLRKIRAGEKRVKRDKVPDLSKLEDVSDFILGAANYDSASESEVDDDSKISVPSREVRKIKVKREEDEPIEQRGVKLVELGPRMTLSLYKITAGISGGQVLHHRDIHLTKQEIEKQNKLHERLAKEKQARKAQQAENLKRKRTEKEESGSRSKRGKLRALEKEKKEGDAEEEEDAESSMSEGELEEEEFGLDAESESEEEQVEDDLDE